MSLRSEGSRLTVGKMWILVPSLDPQNDKDMNVKVLMPKDTVWIATLSK